MDVERHYNFYVPSRTYPKEEHEMQRTLPVALLNKALQEVVAGELTISYTLNAKVSINVIPGDEYDYLDIYISVWEDEDK